LGLFGNITRKLFGGSKSVNESGNKFADDINDQYKPWVATGTKGMGAAANILGLGGGEAQEGALGDWYGSSGGKFLMDQGMDQILGNRASAGLLRSGGTSKALEDYRMGLASTKLNEYLGNIFNLNQQALGAGAQQLGAGQYSKGKSTSDTGGLGKFIGALMASDPRLKTNIVKLGEEPDGLGVYAWDYRPTAGPIAAFMPAGRQRGVMADEVARLRPWALGPVVGGFATVRYDRLEAA
jgi:hypothetical protein